MQGPDTVKRSIDEEAEKIERLSQRTGAAQAHRATDLEGGDDFQPGQPGPQAARRERRPYFGEWRR